MFETILTQFNLLANSANSEQLPFFPSDYKGSISTRPFAKFSVVFSNSREPAYSNKKSVVGLVIISIYYSSGQGQSEPLSFISSIDNIFQDKVLLNGTLTTKKSSIQFLGRDTDDSTLSRVDYTVPFIYYGEI